MERVVELSDTADLRLFSFLRSSTQIFWQNIREMAPKGYIRLRQDPHGELPSRSLSKEPTHHVFPQKRRPVVRWRASPRLDHRPRNSCRAGCPRRCQDRRGCRQSLWQVLTLGPLHRVRCLSSPRLDIQYWSLVLLTSLFIHLSSLGLASYVYSLDGSTTYTYLSFAASSFGEHSLIASIQVAQSVISESPVFPLLTLFSQQMTFRQSLWVNPSLPRSPMSPLVEPPISLSVSLGPNHEFTSHLTWAQCSFMSLVILLKCFKHTKKEEKKERPSRSRI